jgi:molecular chaperone DnaK (HSP70)
MEKFYGFDLGDAESAVSLLVKDGPREPAVLPVAGAGSFITAWARLSDRGLVIGENACYHPDAVERHLRFKSGFLTDPDSASHIRSFASGVLGELYESGSVIKGEDSCFYIGCPAGWDPNARERYRTIFTRLGYPPVRIISESRAALVSACQSRHLQVGYDILSHPVLVVDMGSSTTDFAYISAGREVELQTAGEVRLGGGIMDELLLEISVNASPDEKKLRRVFAESEPWRSYCEFAARRLKE